MGAIDTYKQTLGYGARTNLYRIIFTSPELLGQTTEDLDFEILTHETVLPTSRPIEPIEIPYEGQYVKIAGDKQSEPEWTATFHNTEDMKLLKYFENWMDIMHDDQEGTRISPENYEATNITIVQLDKQKEPQKAIRLFNAFPTNIEPVTLNKQSGELSATTVTFAYTRHINVDVNTLEV